MKKTNLMDEDYKWLEKIIKISTSIEKLYKEIFVLEINGQKDSETYKKNMDYLNISLEVESKIYENVTFNYLKYDELISYLTNQLPSNILDMPECIIERDYRERVIRRIIYNLLAQLQEIALKKYKVELPDDILNFASQFGVFNLNQIANITIYFDNEIKKSLGKDFLTGYLIFLQEFINNDNFNDFQKDLIKSKYNVSFLNKHIESEFKNNNFQIPDVFYPNSSLVPDFSRINSNIYIDLKDSYSFRQAIYQISKLIETSNQDYQDYNQKLTSILRECLIRATFLFMSNEKLEDLNYQFHEYLESDEYRKKSLNNKISEEIIINCFNNIKKDRNKINILSL